MFKASLGTREQFQARTMKRPDLYPKRISWAAFMALCHHVQPKPSEAGVIVPVLQIRLTPRIPNLLSNRTGTCLQDGLLQSHLLSSRCHSALKDATLTAWTIIISQSTGFFVLSIRKARVFGMSPHRHDFSLQKG